MKQLSFLIFSFFCLSLVHAQQAADRSEVKSYPPMLSKGQLLGTVPALRDRAPQTIATGPVADKLYDKKNYFFANEIKNPNALPQGADPLLKKQTYADGGGSGEIIAGFNFEGLNDNSNIAPPDPTGDVGKNHYMQMVNTAGGAWLQVWDKYTGESVYGPALSSTIWGAFGLPTLGDPIVQYDHDAERWLIIEIQANPNNPFASKQLFLGVSDDSDPTGGWHVYLFQTFGFPDYPKFYVWNNAYFLTVNEYLSTNISAGYALDRAAILNNESAFDLYRFVLPNYQTIFFQPPTGADWEAGPPPPAGSPGYIFRIYDDAWEGGQDQLQYWEVFVDWENMAQSHIDGPVKLYPTPFETKVCFGNTLSDCIEQPGTNLRIAAFENNLMYRAPYQNFGTHESIVMNHVTDVSGQVGNGGDAQVRWYELRKIGNGDWQIYQEGTHAPNLAANRITGTISMDEAGNIALGYTGVSETVFPGLYLTGQRVGDPPGEMGLEEYPLALGGAPHGTPRWGDYSSLTLDPYDGRTFWFTGEYQPSANVLWGTRIGSFRVSRDTFDIKPELLLAPAPSATLGAGETVTVKLLNNGLNDAEGFSVSLYMNGVFIATEDVHDTIPSNTSKTFTFNATVDMPTPGATYHFKIITNWGRDQFTRNDTLDANVLKLTSNDASIAGKHNLPGLVCGTEADFGIILQNTSGLPMESARINWRINTQFWKVYNWTGNLAPGARDTVFFHATGISDGLNSLRAYTTLPNGVQDEKISNDSLLVKFYGNSDGTYLSAEANTQFGVLHWELRSQINQLLAMGDLSAQQNYAQVCADDNECYKVVLKANGLNWNGHFTLKTIFGKVLVEAFEASGMEQTFNICTPVRKDVDAGPLELAAPSTRPDLGANEPITVEVRNFGLTDQSGIQVAYRLEGGAWVTETIPGVLTSGQSTLHTFATTEDLSIPGGVYNFDLKTTLTGDQGPQNDSIRATVYHRNALDIGIVDVKQGTVCSDTSMAFLYMVLRNNGLGNQHTVDLAVTLNGQAPVLVGGNVLNAGPDETGEINVLLENLKIGANNVKIQIIEVDHQGPDEEESNDHFERTYQVDPGNISIGLLVTPNDHPEETTWEVLNSSGEVVYSGGPYQTPFMFDLSSLCLPADSCFIFRLHDSGGDGMEGGYISLFIDNIPFLEYNGQNFGSSLDLPFCAASSCAGLQLEANVTNSSSGGVQDGSITAEVSGGTPPYIFGLNGVTQDSAHFINLIPGVYTLAVVDALGCAQEITVHLGAVPVSEPGAGRRLAVYPNPTPGIAHVQIDAIGSENTALLEVFDARGKHVQSVQMTRWDQALHGNIALDKFSSGAYFLRTKGLERVYVTRIVKQ